MGGKCAGELSFAYAILCYEAPCPSQESTLQHTVWQVERWHYYAWGLAWHKCNHDHPRYWRNIGADRAEQKVSGQTNYCCPQTSTLRDSLPNLIEVVLQENRGVSRNFQRCHRSSWESSLKRRGASWAYQSRRAPDDARECKDEGTALDWRNQRKWRRDFDCEWMKC